VGVASDGGGYLLGMRVAVPGLAVIALALSGCGGGSGSGGGDAPTTEKPPPAAPEPVVTLALTSGDDGPRLRDEVVESGDRTSLLVRAQRDGAPLTGEQVELLADPFPYDGTEQVVARARTSSAGRARLLAPFDRNTRVRVRAAGARSDVVEVRRGARLGQASIKDLPDGRELFTGVMRFPKALNPRFRFTVYLGSANRPRLPRVPARVRIRERGPGRVEVTSAFRPAAAGWRVQICVFPLEGGGLAGPKSECRQRSMANSKYEADQERRRQEDEAAG
jgi:hypothetical protein